MYDIDDLPEGWEILPDPESEGAYIGVNTDKDDRVLVLANNLDGNAVVVLCPALVTPAELDGEQVGEFTDLDEAIEFANKLMELEV